MTLDGSGEGSLRGGSGAAAGCGAEPGFVSPASASRSDGDEVTGTFGEGLGGAQPTRATAATIGMCVFIAAFKRIEPRGRSASRSDAPKSCAEKRE